MIRLASLIQEENTFTAINKDSGAVSVFKSKDSRDSAIKAGTHDKSEKVVKGGDSPTSKDVPKTNIFDKPSEKDDDAESKTAEPTKARNGNPAVNKKVKKIAEKLGISLKNMDKEEYGIAMAQSAYEALTDANYHSEARKLIAVLEDKPELAEKPNYPSMSDSDYSEKMKVISDKYKSVYSEAESDSSKLGQSASETAGWNGEEALDAIAYTLKMNGLHKLASKLQSVLDDE